MDINKRSLVSISLDLPDNESVSETSSPDVAQKDQDNLKVIPKSKIKSRKRKKKKKVVLNEQLPIAL